MATKFIPPSTNYYCDSCGKVLNSPAGAFTNNCPPNWSVVQIISPNHPTDNILLCDDHSPVLQSFLDGTLDAFGYQKTLDQKIAALQAAQLAKPLT